MLRTSLAVLSVDCQEGDPTVGHASHVSAFRALHTDHRCQADLLPSVSCLWTSLLCRQAGMSVPIAPPPCPHVDTFLSASWYEPRNGPENQVVLSRKDSSSYSTDVKGSEWYCVGPAQSCAGLRAGASEGEPKPEAAPEKALRQVRGKSTGRAEKADEIVNVSGLGGSPLYK